MALMPIDPLVTLPRPPLRASAPRASRLLVPPVAAMQEVQRAAARCDELAAAGRHVAFRLGSSGLRIELQDAAGATLSRLQPSEALDIAVGAPVS
jgi:hypothetical protein